MSEEKYNSRRKRILENLDKGEEVSIMELGMYDLTPYFKMDNFDTNLYESIMINKNMSRKIEHVDEDLYFSPPQSKALKCLLEKERVIISAPTSFGKTLLVKEYIYIKKPKKVVYIVPTNALAYELESSFKENKKFCQYTIFDRCSQIQTKDDENISEEKLFFIGTQEKFLELDSSIMTSIDLFVIDEAYKLQDSLIKNQRAYKLSETFLRSIAENSKKIFLLTPRASLKGFEKYKFYPFSSSFNAVDKHYTVLKESEFYDALLQQYKNSKNILFCKSPAQINETYKMISKNLVIENNSDFIETLESEIHPDWVVVKLLKARILTHHGQMPKYIQNRMINLFNNNEEYHILFGTNSISEGINTSTKNLFIHPNAINIKPLLLKNTIGRAGRLGKYPIGHIYSTSEIEQLVEQEIEISLAVSSDEELAEIEDSNNDEKLYSFSKEYNIECDFCKEIIKTYKISLNKLAQVMNALKEDKKYDSFTNLPYIAKKVFASEYMSNPKTDVILMRGYFQYYYLKDKKQIPLNNYDDRINFFKKSSSLNIDNTEIINMYMHFIYSTLEYYIMPIVNIGLEIYDHNKEWKFGKFIISSIEKCKKKYYLKTYGDLQIDNLSDSHILIVEAMKDYGMIGTLRKINIDILDEIDEQLNVRYSTIDVINAIKYLSVNSQKNKSFYLELVKKYYL